MGLVAGSLQWHADEFYSVCVPLKLFSGERDAGLNLTAFYPGFHDARLAALYGLFFSIQQITSGVSFIGSGKVVFVRYLPTTIARIK